MGEKRSNAVLRFLENTVSNPIAKAALVKLGDMVDPEAAGKVDKATALPEFNLLTPEAKSQLLDSEVKEPLEELITSIARKALEKWDDPTIGDEEREKRVDALRSEILSEYYDEAKERLLSRF